LKSFGLTMAFSIAVSMLVSFSLTPMLASRWLRPARRTESGAAHKSVLERVVDYGYRPVERLYMTVLGWVMRHRYVVVLAALGALYSMGSLVKVVNKDFLPRSDEAQFEVNVRTVEGTSMEATELVAERIARKVRKLTGVQSTLLTIGDNNQRTPNLARIYVRLVDPGKRKLSQNQMMDRVRKEILPHESKQLRLGVSEVALFNNGGSTSLIQYELTGPDLHQLEDYARRTQAELKKVSGAVDVDSSLIDGKPELQLSVERDRAISLGVQIADVANALHMLVGGVDVSHYEENGEQYDIHLRADAAFRGNVEALGLLSVQGARGRAVPLTDLVKVERTSGPSQINRYNRRRQVQLFANVAPGHSEGEVLAGLEKAIANLHMPADYSSGPVGRSKELGKTQKAFVFAFGMSFIFMYLTLAAQFESWLHPITILLSLPLTLPFALLSLILFQQSFNIYSGLGILVLFGVVKKNAILQIDHTNNLRRAGMPRDAALLEANRDRLRPILMTTLAFVMGMVPLLWSSGIGAGFNRATAGPIVGGQLLSLMLTLLATPVAYSLFDDLSTFVKKLLPKSATPESLAPDSAAPEASPAE
jgi:multidrug efflux pump subunit AcrB